MDDPAGIHVLTLDDPSGQVARDWLAQHGASAMLPPPYTRDDVLMRHVDRAVRPVSNFLSARRHVNRLDGRQFRAVVYLADDPSVTAYSVAVRGTHVVVIGAAWMFRLVGICDRLALPLARRPRTGPPRDEPEQAPPPDPVLTSLLEGGTDVGEAEAQAIAATWPSPRYVHSELELGPWAVFYDLLRLVWLHELAHALCGHTGFVADGLGLTALDESPARGRRAGVAPAPVDGPTGEVLQTLEMHADEWSVRQNLGEILYGRDPVGEYLALGVDLGDRLLHLTTAFGVFALLWELAEQRATTPRVEAADRTHPPVALRHDRFRGFQRQAALEYDPGLVTAVDVLTLGFLDELAHASPHFGALRGLTPVVVRTPSMDRAEEDERHLLRLAPAIAEHLDRHAFVPTGFVDAPKG